MHLRACIVFLLGAKFLANESTTTDECVKIVNDLSDFWRSCIDELAWFGHFKNIEFPSNVSLGVFP